MGMKRLILGASLMLVAMLLPACGPTPLGWERDEAQAQQCADLGKDAPHQACEYCCHKQAKASGHNWIKGEGCECL